jgi:hypothetical protein
MQTDNIHPSWAGYKELAEKARWVAEIVMIYADRVGIVRIEYQ